jgi:hypothetical protein
MFAKRLKWKKRAEQSKDYRQMYNSNNSNPGNHHPSNRKNS